MKQQWQELNAKYQLISAREKVMVLLAGVILVLFVGYFNLLEPLWLKQDKLESGIKTLKADKKSLASEKSIYLQHLGTDPNVSLNNVHEKQAKVIVELDQQLDEQTVNLVSPDSMPKVIQSLLQQMKGLTVLSMKAGQPKALMQEGQDNLYRHGLTLQLSGNYQNLYQFLAKAESLPWKFHWHDFQLTVTEFPTVELSVNVYTLSLEQGFIGL